MWRDDLANKKVRLETFWPRAELHLFQTVLIKN
jgi:hypothetical protein